MDREAIYGRLPRFLQNAAVSIEGWRIRRYRYDASFRPLLAEYLGRSGDSPDEVRAFREACGEAHLKTILATGELGSLRNVGKASLVCMMAGADFIKTSTGKESVNATLPVGLVMVRSIRDYRERTGYDVGLKPAGGIRSAKETLVWLSMMRDELGLPWTRPGLFRFGASSLLRDLERQLEHLATGRYSAGYRHPLA